MNNDATDDPHDARHDAPHHALHDAPHDAPHDASVAPGLPGPASARLAAARAGRRVPWSQIMSTWAPVAAGVIRAVAGLIAFSAALLTLPTHVATPFLTGVGLLMLVGGCVSVIKACQDEPQLRWFARLFPLGCGLVATLCVVLVLVYGAGAFGPDIMGDPTVRRAPVDDGTVRFQSE